MAGRIRKRMMVTEGDLMQLWFEVEQVRKEEKKAQFKANFKQLLHDAELVKIQIVKKNRASRASDTKGKEVANG